MTDWNERARLVGRDPGKAREILHVLRNIAPVRGIFFNDHPSGQMNGKVHSCWDRLDDLEPLAVEVGWCVGALAARRGISRRQLSLLFREEFQTCPREWLGQVRLRHALAKTRDNVAAKVIALDLGYRHCSDFIRAFKHLTGTTPGKVGRDSPNNHLLGEEVCGMAQNAYRKMLFSRAP